MKKWGWVGLISIVIIASGVYFLTKTKPSHETSTLPVTSPAASISLTPATSPSPSSSPHMSPLRSSPIPSVSGAPSGRITCTYQIPPAPNQYGDAKITSVWTNTQINVCVSANGNSQTLVASDTRTSSTRTDDVNWLASNTSYVFTLYNHYSGDPVCSGPVLATCQISTH